jgi:hypothetical protein
VKIYPTVPPAIVEGWTTRDSTHPPLEQVPLHFHDAEEWLEVRRGQMTFYTLSGRAWTLGAANVLHIPRGEVHRAEIGPDGVSYRMYVPVDSRTGFTKALSDDEIGLLRTNLAFPLEEDKTNGGATAFFEPLLSEHLAFGRADLSVITKQDFLGGFTARDRSSSGTITVLNCSPDGMLMSTVVTMGTSGPSPQHFTNLRLFVKEGSAWKLRVWMNHPAQSDGT